jgi:hypothetical protein
MQNITKLALTILNPLIVLGVPQINIFEVNATIGRF